MIPQADVENALKLISGIKDKTDLLGNLRRNNPFSSKYYQDNLINTTVPRQAIVVNDPGSVDSNENNVLSGISPLASAPSITNSKNTANTEVKPTTTATTSAPKQPSKPSVQSNDKPHYAPSWVDIDDEINRRYAEMWAKENQQEQPAQVVQPTEPAPVTNTRKPVQKSTGFTYMPMSTDQAVDLRRKQYGKSYF